MLKAIDHIQLAMPAGGEDEARAFYSGVLGVPEREKPPKLAARGGAWFENDVVRIHLGVDKDFRPARKAHPAFIVEGLAILAAAIKQHGCDVVEDDDLPGYNRIYASDPFGNRLEFMEKT